MKSGDSTSDGWNEIKNIFSDSTLYTYYKYILREKKSLYIVTHPIKYFVF